MQYRGLQRVTAWLNKTKAPKLFTNQHKAGI